MNDDVQLYNPEDVANISVGGTHAWKYKGEFVTVEGEDLIARGRVPLGADLDVDIIDITRQFDQVNSFISYDAIKKLILEVLFTMPNDDIDTVVRQIINEVAVTDSIELLNASVIEYATGRHPSPEDMLMLSEAPTTEDTINDLLESVIRVIRPAIKHYSEFGWYAGFVPMNSKTKCRIYYFYIR